MRMKRKKQKILEKKDRSKRFDVLQSEWKWFPKPFELPKDKNNVKIKKYDDTYEIEFTIQRSKTTKKWIQE